MIDGTIGTLRESGIEVSDRASKPTTRTTKVQVADKAEADEPKPADKKPVDTKPADKKPADTKPAAKKPSIEPPTVESRRDLLRREQYRREQWKSNMVVLAAGVVFLAIGIVVGLALPWDPFGTGGAKAPSMFVPPDGNAAAAWITVPSKNTKPSALIVDVHTDYQCPYCKITELSYGSLFKTLNDRGDIIWRQHTRTFLDGALQNDSSTRAAVAAACIDVADDTKFADYHLTIFANQPNEGTGYTDDQLRNQWPVAVGLSDKALATFQQCYDAQQTLQFVKAVETNNLAPVKNPKPPNAYLFGGNTPIVDSDGKCSGTVGTAIGVCGTPTFFVSGVKFDLGSLFNSDGTPMYTTADDLLAMLTQLAAS